MAADNGAELDWLRPTARVRHVSVSSWKIGKRLRIFFKVAEGMKDARGRVSTWNAGAEVTFARVPASIVASHKGKVHGCRNAITPAHCVHIVWSFIELSNIVNELVGSWKYCVKCNSF